MIDMGVDQEAWLAQGRKMGWISEGWCWTHDSPVLSAEEEQALAEDAGDPDGLCFIVARVY